MFSYLHGTNGSNTYIQSKSTVSNTCKKAEKKAVDNLFISIFMILFFNYFLLKLLWSYIIILITSAKTISLLLLWINIS